MKASRCAAPQNGPHFLKQIQIGQLGSVMSKLIFQSLATMLIAAVSMFTAAKDVTREGAPELMLECQQQREGNIAPLRDQAIEDCVTGQGKDREYCERFNRTFGNATPRASGGMIPGMFWELPVCEKAVAAEQCFKMNTSKQVYNLP
jgi:hypothetical protein